MEAVFTRYLRKLRQHRLSTYVLIGLVGVLLLQFGESAGPKFNWLAKHKNRSDYKSFYLTAVDKFENDNSLYHLHRGGLHNLRPDALSYLKRHTYANVLPPLTTIAYLPFTLLPLQTGQKAWLFGTVFLMLASLLLLGALTRMAGVKVDGLLLSVWALVWLTHCRGFYQHLFHGQINVHVMFLFWAGVYFHARKRPNSYVAAVLIGLAVMLKPFMAIGLVPLLIYRSGKLIFLVPLVWMVIVAVTMPWVGIADYLRFPQAMFESNYLNFDANMRDGYSLRHHVFELFRTMGWQNAPTWLTWALPVMFGVRCYRESVRQLPLVIQLIRIAEAFLFLGTVMMVTWRHHFVLVYPLVLILSSIYLIHLRGWILHLCGLLLSYYLLHRTINEGLPTYWYSIGLVGLWLVAEGTVARLKVTGLRVPTPFLSLEKMAKTK